MIEWLCFYTAHAIYRIPYAGWFISSMSLKCLLHCMPLVLGIHWWPVNSPHKGLAMQSSDISFIEQVVGKIFQVPMIWDNWMPMWHHCDDIIKWKHFPRNWPFVRGIHWSPVNSPYKGQWRGALMFSLICVWKNGWVNNCEAGDLRRYHAHYDVTIMSWCLITVTLLECHCNSNHQQHNYFLNSFLSNPPITFPFWVESTGHCWIPFTKVQ